MRNFYARVTAIGEMAGDFIDEGILVFFADSAPEELHEHAVVHDDKETLTADVKVGDVIHIGDNAFPVLAIGNVANENIRNLGHIVVKFNGLTEPEMQGDITVPEGPIPEITVGMKISITSKE